MARSRGSDAWFVSIRLSTSWGSVEWKLHFSEAFRSDGYKKQTGGIRFDLLYAIAYAVASDAFNGFALFFSMCTAESLQLRLPCKLGFL